MTLAQSEVKRASLDRIEQETLAQFLNKFGIEAKVEFPITVEGEFYCDTCHFRTNEIALHDGHHLLEKVYLLDVYLPKYRIEVAINGEIHKTKGAQKHDSERAKYLESKGIESIPFDTGTFLDSKGNPRYDRIESFARLCARLAGK